MNTDPYHTIDDHLDRVRGLIRKVRDLVDESHDGDTDFLLEQLQVDVSLAAKGAEESLDTIEDALHSKFTPEDS